MPGAVIVGAGPGVGRAVAARFAREGLPIALIARSSATLAVTGEALAGYDVPVLSLPADSSDEPVLRTALDRAVAEHGIPSVVVYNAALVRPDRIGDLSLREHLDAWAVNVGGALVTAAHLAPRMTSGTFLITSGMPQPVATYASLSLGKAGVRTLVTLLNQTYDIHAASVTIAGDVAPGTAFDPDVIADHYWRLHTEPAGAWTSEVLIS